ncbi:hypothetical protein E3T25_08820 [Cryobacterium sandaracinum]|uniref:Uncharacterized protein n=1 Tax=Cryobacterium sandaracinum TaxID=1259247 RepID=A0ABY2JBS1_9MICO|nr:MULTISPECIES: hypothetical protein [Cryobacterium]TFC65924.1 hypothetical protein E3O54_11560 [Cryobacterium sp. TMT2-4]TFD02415.1 hypothetical protein E3T25_08820 [Cryobacterium sandaracinum]
MTIPNPPQFDFNRAISPDTEEVGVALLRLLFSRIASAEAKLKGEFFAVVDDRSSLRLDDRYLGRWRTGSLHGTAMSASVDALLAVQTILESVLAGTGALPMSALYPMIRAALESASLAIYLLEPVSRDERLRRSYMVAVEDAKYFDTFQISLGNLNSRSKSLAQAEIRALIATRPSLGDPADFPFTTVTYSDTVKKAEVAITADPAIPTSARMALLAWWKLLSGLSHGKQWAFVEAMERSEAVVDVENQSAQIRMTSSIAAVALVTQRAIEALETALNLYGRRSRVTWTEVEDASEPPTLSYTALQNENDARED